MSASVGCMVSIAVILVKMKDQPLSRWTFFLSLPATVAIFATASKSTAALAVAACISQSKWLHFSMATRILGDLDLFEEASRGPIGSLKLLATRPRGLASIGAVATVLALGLDVFIQQVIRFSPVDVARDDGNALFGLTHTYYGGAKLVASSSATFGIEGMLILGLRGQRFVKLRGERESPLAATASIDLSVYSVNCGYVDARGYLQRPVRYRLSGCV